MIVTLTVNPALDRTLSVDRLAFEDRAYIESRHESPGGRGMNAACVIHSFGGKPLAIFPSGGKNGKCFEELLSGFGYDTVAVPTGHEIRTNLTITDRQGLTVSVNERGPQLGRAGRRSPGESRTKESGWRRLADVVRQFASRRAGEFLRPPDRNGAAQERAAPCSTPMATALREGIEAAPTVVAPNQHEAERLLNRALFTRNHFLEAVAAIRAMGAGDGSALARQPRCPGRHRTVRLSRPSRRAWKCYVP